MQAAGGTDSDDESDPALSDTNLSQFMEAYTPEAVLGRLADKLIETGGDSTKLGDMVSAMQPISIGQYGLVLGYHSRQFLPEDLALLNSQQSSRLINQAYLGLKLSGSVTINALQNDGVDSGIKYRPANFLEMRRLADNQFICTANRILETTLSEAKIVDDRH